MTQHPNIHRKQWLERLIIENEFKYGCEIGVHEGVTHFYLLDTCPGLVLVGVDRYQGVQEQYFNTFKQGAEKYGIRSRFHRESSVDASNRYGKGELDFIFIDADHSYNGVMSDLKAWDIKVRKGGYVTGHDVNLPAVKKALDDFYGLDNYEIANHDDVWYVKK